MSSLQSIRASVASCFTAILKKKSHPATRVKIPAVSNHLAQLGFDTRAGRFELLHGLKVDNIMKHAAIALPAFLDRRLPRLSLEGGARADQPPTDRSLDPAAAP